MKNLEVKITNVEQINGVTTGYFANPNPCFATKQQAEAAIALAKLSQIKFTPYWSQEPEDIGASYYTITWDTVDGFEIVETLNEKFFSFGNKQLAEEFLGYFKELLYEAVPLM